MTFSSPPEDKESSPCQLEGINLCRSNCTLDVMRHVYSNVGGSIKRADQPCSSSSLQSKRSRENSDIGGEYSSPCSPFDMSLNPVLQFLHLSSQCSTV